MGTDLKHIKVRETTTLPDGTNEIKTQSYTDELASDKLEREKSHPTSQNTLYKDVLTCLTVLSDSEELTLKIVKKHGQPHRIIQTWTVERNRYGK